jgi:hypothetical protein
VKRRVRLDGDLVGWVWEEPDGSGWGGLFYAGRQSKPNTMLETYPDQMRAMVEVAERYLYRLHDE